ncbi:hypothetical protein J6590_029826 [Homalodisca vitripennis]|nr:hypothetical protein J6590_029826 [Homalodisca vitripennis]
MQVTNDPRASSSRNFKKIYRRPSVTWYKQWLWPKYPNKRKTFRSDCIRVTRHRAAVSGMRGNRSPPSQVDSNRLPKNSVNS